MKKLVTWDNALARLYRQKEVDGYDPYNLEYMEIFKGLQDFFDDQSEKGWNLVCFVDDKILEEQFGFMFEESKTVYKHELIFLDDVMETAKANWMQSGEEYTVEHIAKILEHENVFTPMYVPSLRYVLDMGSYFTLPIYICRWEDSPEDKKKLYAEYQTETKKNAIFRGKETKGFIEWSKKE